MNYRKKQNTSWGSVAKWYNTYLEDSDTYHTKVILPAILRLIPHLKGKVILDLACGQGYFSRAIAKAGAEVIGVDISEELIAIAKEKNKTEKQNINYFVSPSHDLYTVKSQSVDYVICVLALQNIEDINKTFKEVARVLKKKGVFIFVLNHPSFRVPGESSWVYDKINKKQYRRVDAYLSESKVKIDMTPGSKKDKKYTVSFHRPFQVWAKALYRQDFLISRVEEWISHRESKKGPRQNAENKARHEIPLFLMIEAVH